MTRKDLINAYDSVNPTREEKERMLRGILEKAELKPRQGSPREREIYTAKAPRKRRTSPLLLMAACFAVILLCGFWVGRSLLPAQQPGAATADSAYSQVLEVYTRAVRENWTAQQCMEAGISSRTVLDREKDGLYYALSDLDGDGVEELVVTESTWGDNRTEFLALYTLQKGEPVLIASDREFLRPMLFEGGVIMHTDPGQENPGAWNYACYLRLEGEILVMEVACYQAEDGQWYEQSPQKRTAEKITQERAGEIAASYRRAELDFRSLAEKEETPSLTGDNHYDEILTRYESALAEGWTAEQCEAADISVNIAYAGADLGWCTMDLDGNGTRELIIADGERLYDLYTPMVGEGIALHILTSWGSNADRLCENGMLLMQEFYSKGCGWFWFALEGTEIVLQDMVHYTNFQEANAYSYGPDSGNLAPIDKDRAGELISRYGPAELELTPFRAARQDRPDEQTLYEGVLQTYAHALEQDWNPGACMDAGISLMVGYCGELYDTLGYGLQDLDGDSIRELIITDGEKIYDLYTIVDDEQLGPLRLLTATERSIYRLMEGNVIFNGGSGGAAVSSFCWYRLARRELVLLEGYLFDATESGENPWYLYDGENRGEPCGDMTAAAETDFGYTPVGIPFTPLR